MPTKTQAAPAVNGSVNVKVMTKEQLVAYAQTSTKARNAAALELLRRAENRIEKRNAS